MPLIQYVARKILQAVPTLLGVWTLIFVLFQFVGGDPAYLMLGEHASTQQVAEVRRQYGYDQPVLLQYARFLGDCLSLDFGESRISRQPIAGIISEALGPTLSLALPAFLLTTLLAVLGGLLVAYHRGRWLDRGVMLVCLVGMSVPMLAYILVGQYVLAFWLKWFPIHGYEAEWSERVSYLVLPALIWVTVFLGYGIRYYRSVFVEEVGQDYVRTARSKGVSELVVFGKHVLRNGLVAILSAMAAELPTLVLGSFLLESFFGIPGLGSVTIAALHNADLPMIRAMTTLLAVLFVGVNLLTDVLYSVVDPRVRLA